MSQCYIKSLSNLFTLDSLSRSYLKYKEDGEILVKNKIIYDISLQHLSCEIKSQNSELCSCGTIMKRIATFNHDIKAICSGLKHVVFLSTRGEVFTYGDNQYGQLGAGHSTEITRLYKTNLTRIDQISSASDATVALSKSLNQIWYWGQSNIYFNSKQSTPVLIELPTKLFPIFINASRADLAIIDKNNKVYRLVNKCGSSNYNIKATVSFEEFDISKQSDLKFVATMATVDGRILVTKDGRLYKSDYIDKTNQNFNLWCNSRYDNFCKHTVFTKGSAFGICTNIDFVALLSHSNSPDLIAVDNLGICYQLKNYNFESFPDQNSFSFSFGTLVVSWINKFEEEMDISSADTTGPDKNFTFFKDMYNSEELSDVEVKLSDGIVKAHKMVLSLRSSVLKKTIVLSAAMSLKKQSLLDLTNIDPTSYRLYIKYLYTGVLEYAAIEQIPEIFRVAREDENIDLKKLCLQIWIKKLKKDNLLSSFHLAYGYKLHILLMECQVFKKHLQYFIDADEYKSWPSDERIWFWS